MKLMTGIEKVAVVLLALDRSRATQLLQRFDQEDLDLITRSASDLGPIESADLEQLVDEFAEKLASGINFVGSAKEVESLLAEVSQNQPLEMEFGTPLLEDEPVWEKILALKPDVVCAYILNEHPQTAALILSKLDSSYAAKVINLVPPQLRSSLLCRMLGIKTVSYEAEAIIEMALREDLIDLPSQSGGGTHASVADILNRLDKSQTDEILSILGEVRPEDVRALKAMLFSFEELATLDAKTRGVLMDKFPIERVVLALNGTDPEFQGIVLSSLGTRARRMVEAELSSGATPNPRDVQEARRAIVETVLQAASRGEVQLRGTIAGGEQAA